MILFIEFHLIQSFARSNLNRDDTGAPKDAIFGGQRRARVSSQCVKRSIRLKAAELGTIPCEFGSVRTKKLKALLMERLADLGHGDASTQIDSALAAAGLKVKDDGKTEYLLFLGQGEIDRLADLIHTHWDALAAAPASDAKKTKKEPKASAPPAVVKEAKALLDGQKTVNVAMFGRMLADLPGVNQYAACQVAHAISTHRVEREFDDFTAVDDKGDIDETGAGMIGQVEFNSAIFYRYAVIDPNKLVANLKGDKDLALKGIAAFTQAMARAIPTGKQNTFAAHNPPSFVGLVVRHTSPFNLANAFEKPIWPKQDQALTALSVRGLRCAAGPRRAGGLAMPTLLLRLAGPMQSWGTTNRFDERDSQPEPSKSGLLGLVCAALGRDRADSVEDLASLRMGVRVDREGLLMRDYQTATGVMTAAGKTDPNRTVVSPRYYLADGAFLVGLEGEDRDLLARIQAALRAPVWPLALGRKAFPPGAPVWIPDGLLSAGLREALTDSPRVTAPRWEHREDPLRLVLENAESGSMRMDQPAAPFAERGFGPRYVVAEVVHVPV
jgi:CRISPR system Cascade subunit CasC